MTSKKQSKADESQEQEAPGWKGSFYRARAKAQAQEPEQHTLPGVPVTPKGTAPMGNELARTPLFAPIKRGRRKIHDMTPLPSPEGVSLWYFGKQLDVGDQDTYLTAIMLAKGLPADTPVRINRAEFLRLMGRGQSGKAYKLLQQSFTRVSPGRLFYDTPQEEGSTPLLGPLRYDKEAEEFYFTIPKESLRAFGFQAFGYVDMEKRRLIAGKNAELAKWLQCYAVSHKKGEHNISITNLKAWSGYEGRVRDFRTYLATALDELVRVGVLETWSFYDEDNKIKWIR